MLTLIKIKCSTTFTSGRPSGAGFLQVRPAPHLLRRPQTRKPDRSVDREAEQVEMTLFDPSAFRVYFCKNSFVSMFNQPPSLLELKCCHFYFKYFLNCKLNLRLLKWEAVCNLSLFRSIQIVILTTVVNAILPFKCEK